jgi:ribokinase
MRKPVITVVGSFAVGMTLRTARMPIFGETLLGSDFDMGPGGKGSNQAVALARLGAEAHFVGVIGSDKLGTIATELYKEEGVQTEHLEQTGEKATGAGFIILSPEGDNCIILDMGANELLDAAAVDRAEELIARSDLVMSVLEIPLEAAMRAMQLGKKHGVPTLLNPAPARPLPSEIFGHVDLLTPNETELRVLLGRSPDDDVPTRDLVDELKSLGVSRVVVTMGEQGALIVERDGSKQAVNPVPVDAVDTTGAGDAFNAGLAVALAEGKSLEQATAFASCTGALACKALGVIPSLAYRSDADRLHQQVLHERTLT